MNRTALVADRRYLDHYAGRVHPERPERVAVMIEMAGHLKRPDLKVYAPRAATRAELELCHSSEYIAAVEHTATLERSNFDPDTHTSRETCKTATLAAGGVLTAVEAVMAGEAHNAFAIVRPPGHHAMANRAMGFCFFNNVSIAAAALIANHGLKRVLILDWDVHHGNGTQDLFYASPKCSTCRCINTRSIPAVACSRKLAQAQARVTRLTCRCPRRSATTSICGFSTMF